MSRDEAHGAEMEKDSVEAEEATFSTTFWQQMDRQNTTPWPHGKTRSKREDSDVQSHLSDYLEDKYGISSKYSLTPTKYSQGEESFSALQVLFAGGGYDLL